MRIKNTIAIALFFVVLNNTQAQETAYSLKEAQEFALKNNYNLLNAERDISIAKKKVWETTAIGLPQVNAEFKLQNFIDIPTSVIPASTFNPMAKADEFTELQMGTNYNNTASITASQLIFDGSYIVGLQAAKTYKELSINNKKKTEQDVKDLVAQAYYTVLVATENHNVLIESAKSIQTLLNETKAMFNEGLTEEQNVDQLSLNLANISNNVAQAERQKEVSKKLLKFQMGIDIAQNIELSDNLDALISQQDASGLLKQEFNFNTHTDYALSQTSEKLMKLNYRKEKYSFLPSIGAFFSHQQSNMSNDFNAFSDGKWYPTTLWGLSLKLPILTSGMRIVKMGQAKLDYEKAKTSSKQAEQGLMLKAQTAQTNFNMAYDSFNNQKQSLELAKTIHNKMIKKYSEGMISSMDFTQSQTQLLNTEGQYIKAMLDLLNAKSALQKALGSN